MFLDAGAEEIMVVALAALVFVKPKDLPVVLRKVGQVTAKMRGLAAEFRASFDEMARQSELDELKREVDALRRGEPMMPIKRELDSHFESLHREMGAPPPAGFGAREGEMVEGPGASVALPPPVPPPLPEPFAPETLSQDPEAIRPPGPAPRRPPEPEA